MSRRRKGVGLTAGRAALAGLAMIVALTACSTEDDDRSEHPGQSPTPVEVTPAPEGIDGEYVVRSVAGDPELSGGPAAKLTLATGEFGFQAGCNNFMGTATWEGDRLQVPDLETTLLGCDPELMARDDAFLEFFKAGPVATESDGELVLTAGDSKLTLVASEPAPDQPLTGGPWQLTSIIEGSGPDGAAASVPRGTRATLHFQDVGQLLVFSGCNSGGGRYVVRGATLTVSTLGLTERLCADPAMRLETEVVAVLGSDPAIEVDGNRLRLTPPVGSGVETALEFTRG